MANENDKEFEKLKALAIKQTDPKLKQAIEEKMKYVNKPVKK